MAGFLVWMALGYQSSEGQYTANFQTNIISGVTSNWSGDYYVGNTNFADVLIVQSAGILGDIAAFVGNTSASSNNSVLVTDPGSVWSNHASLFFGAAGPGNSLVISNGGWVIGFSPSEAFVVGDGPGSSNNRVLVTGSGSVWSNAGDITIGLYGVSNSMTIANGGRVYSYHGLLSAGCDQSGCIDTGYCSVVVSGLGSTWSNAADLIVGVTGSGSSLVISNGGTVFSADGIFGGSCIGREGATSNTTLVTGGSLWSNVTLYVGKDGAWNSLLIGPGPDVAGGTVISRTGIVGSNGNSNTVQIANRGIWRCDSLIVGNLGSSNSLQIGDGSVSATSVVVGAASTTCDNLVEVDISGNLVVTNASGTGVLDVRHGELIINGGVLQADTLVITNSCAQFVHTGGTLLVGNVVLDPNTFRIVSVARQSNDMQVTWMMGPGATNTLQATAGDGSGGYSTNGFTDIFIVTNNTTVGTVTNYLDLGAATNMPSRYYRARLVP
jgi:T5SS/PEP-CTERM-associated repeat protein